MMVTPTPEQHRELVRLLYKRITEAGAPPDAYVGQLAEDVWDMVQTMTPRAIDHDLVWLLFAAVRYSLGRMSGAAGLTAGIVRQHMASLNPNQRATMVEDIESHLRGWPQTYDAETWSRLAQDLVGA